MSNIAISHHFSRVFKADKIHPPRNFSLPILPVESEVYLEIGAGKGMHALKFANNSQAYLYAVERTKEKFVAFEKAASQEELTNLQPIHADAIAWVVHALPPQSLNGVFILYPNPEPANSNQRWLNMPFFELLLSRVKDTGKIVMATNIESYAQEALSQALNIWQLDATLTDVPKNSQRTHFEVKYLARGETCWQLDITKPAAYTTRFDDFSMVK